MAKRDYLKEHLENPKFSDKPIFVGDEKAAFRLSRGKTDFEGSWDDICKIIALSFRRKVHWFPDANTAIIPNAQKIWKKLQSVSTGSAQSSTMLNAVILEELEEWLREPHHSKDLASTILQGLKRKKGWIKRDSFDIASPIAGAIFGYMKLLGERRSLAISFGDDQKTILGADSTNKSEALNAVKDHSGHRSMALARKGRAEWEEKKQVNVNDELNCMMVIAHALRTGTESIIITADEDLKEIFWKAQWFLNTHYRAWLAAKRVKEGLYGEEFKSLAETDGYFNGPLKLFRRPSPDLRETLPRNYSPVIVQLFYVSPSNRIHALYANFEREMLGMLETRSKTNGRCTDLFGDMNIHVDLGHLQKTAGELCLGVGKDKTHEHLTFGVPSSFSLLDVEHCINNQERQARAFFKRS